MSSSYPIQRFDAYLNQLEVWKVQYPYLETFRSPLPGAAQGIPDFALPVNQNPEQLVATCVEWLEAYIVNNEHISEDRKANIIYTVLDYLDVTLLKSGVKQLLLYKDESVFINPFRYWKAGGQPRPLSSSTRSFETFGHCDWDKHCRHLILSELVPDSGDPLRRIQTLNLGLFQLSEHWAIQWKYTKLLNAARKTHGLVAADTVHPDREAEFSLIVEHARQTNLHIACFPELTLRPADKDHLWHRLLDEYVRLQGLPFFMLVGGSFHLPAGDHFVNRMPLVIYCKGHTFDHFYDKHEPFSGRFDHMIPRDPTGAFDFTLFPDWREFSLSAESSSILAEYGYEDIEHNPGITILETDTFGKFGFAICKDVLPDQSKILGQYGSMIDHLVVISLNASGKADFSTIASQLARKRWIATYYTNARWFDPKHETPTFMAKMPEGGAGDPIINKIGLYDNLLVAQLEQKGMPSRRTL